MKTDNIELQKLGNKYQELKENLNKLSVEEVFLNVFKVVSALTRQLKQNPNSSKKIQLEEIQLELMTKYREKFSLLLKGVNINSVKGIRLKPVVSLVTSFSQTAIETEVLCQLINWQVIDSGFQVTETLTLGSWLIKNEKNDGFNQEQKNHVTMVREAIRNISGKRPRPSEECEENNQKPSKMPKNEDIQWQFYRGSVRVGAQNKISLPVQTSPIFFNSDNKSDTGSDHSYQEGIAKFNSDTSDLSLVELQEEANKEWQVILTP